jgi:carbonic anhydrase
MTPQQAREALILGNRRFLEIHAEHPRCGAQRRKETHERGQNPMATVVGCSDSRVPLELLFDQGVGDIFAVRSAGHVLDSVGLASVEYSVDHLKVSLVLVLGHTRCGAVTAAVKGGKTHGHLPKLLRRLRQAVEVAKSASPGLQGEHLVERAIEAQVELTVRQVQDESAIMRKAVQAGTCQVAGGIYDLASGHVRWLRAD